MAQNAIFIQSNRKQLLGAKIAKYALETAGGAIAHGIPVKIIEVELVPAFQRFVGSTYRHGYDAYTFDDLQSFTLTRFMPPELMNYKGRALVIDPDIFAIADVTPLFERDMGTTAIAACGKNGLWDSSVMVLECARLTHWRISDILTDIASGTRTYEDISPLKDETASIQELPRIWNSLDNITSDTRLFHTTNRLTQPWRTGLPIDFTFNPVPKLFGILPRFWVQHPTQYQEHPDHSVIRAFFTIADKAVTSGALSKTEIDAAIATHDLRIDFWQALDQVRQSPASP